MNGLVGVVSGMQTQQAAPNACPKVAIVVLNWNGWVDTVQCLESIFRSDYPNYMVVICDNGSEDDSVNRIKDWAEGRLNPRVSKSDPLCQLVFPPVQKPIPYVELRRTDAEDESVPADPNARLILIRIERNLGFARGNNIGMRYALRCKAEYIFVLNNDTVVEPTCIRQLVRFGEDHPEAALMGPKILDGDFKSYTQWPMAKRLDFVVLLLAISPLRWLIYRTFLFRQFFYRGDLPAVVHLISGCAMMFRLSTVHQVGLFDEVTFLYYEEVIMAEKLRKQNLLTFVVLDAVICHKKWGSTGKIGARNFIENNRSERYVSEKYLCLPVWQRAILSGVRLAAYVCRMVVDRDYRRNWRNFVRTLREEEARGVESH